MPAESAHTPLQAALMRVRDDAVYWAAVVRDSWAAQQATGLAERDWAQVVAVAAALHEEEQEEGERPD